MRERVLDPITVHKSTLNIVGDIADTGKFFDIAAVILETIPHIDQSVGNAPGNFFDVFEAFSVSIFMLEYLLRLFSVVKDREPTSKYQRP